MNEYYWTYGYNAAFKNSKMNQKLYIFQFLSEPFVQNLQNQPAF